MASNEVLLLSMFSFAALAITLVNTIANVLLNQMVVRWHNMARATALECYTPFLHRDLRYILRVFLEGVLLERAFVL